jgi:hypothetical protein
MGRGIIIGLKRNMGEWKKEDKWIEENKDGGEHNYFNVKEREKLITKKWKDVQGKVWGKE